MSDDFAERLIRIERHAAHLERQLEQLNEVVIDQGKTIERLKKQVLLQAEFMKTFELERMKANNPKPPHHG